MANPKNISVREVLHKRILMTGLYDHERANELVGRLENNEQAMLTLIGRLAVEAERGGTGAQQGIRALINSAAVPTALETYNQLLSHELSDESFPKTVA